MNPKAISLLMLTLTVTIMIAVLTPFIRSAGSARVYINPMNNYLSVGQTFTINATIANVTNLNAWQLQLSFNPRILKCDSVSVPNDNILGNLIWFPPPEINNSLGYLTAFCAKQGGGGVTGTGTLLQIRFNCTDPGISLIGIINKMEWTGTHLLDPNNNFIAFETFDGMAEVSASGFQENIFYVTQDGKTYNIIIFSNSTVSSFGFNQSLREMTFNVSGLFGTRGSSNIVIPKKVLNGTIAVLLDNNAISYILFENATHNILQFTYQHSTKVVTILLTVYGDVNGDRKVDMVDLYLVAKAFGSYPGHYRWDPGADVNRDNQIDMVDLYLVSKNFGMIWKP